MKTIIIILTLVTLTTWAGDPYQVTNVVTTYPARDKGTFGAIERQQTFRGTNKVYEFLRVDSDKDGSIDATQQLFWVHDEAIVSMGSIKKNENGIQFASKDNIGASLQDTNHDGAVDTVLIMTDNFELLDLYRRTDDGLFAPINSDEYEQVRKGAQTIAPFVTNTVNAISKPE